MNLETLEHADIDGRAGESFAGFSRRSLNFLKALTVNNDKVWFEANRHEYEKHLLEPMQRLVADLGEFMLSIDPLFEIRPAVNKTISRIYRDTRFSRDKSPYRTTMWFTFKRSGGGWQDAPAYFFEIAPISYRYGMGFYSASKQTMDGLREKMLAKPKEFLKAISFYNKQNTFVIEGEQYKRVLNQDISENIRNWYQRKNLYLVCNRKIDNALFSRKLFDDIRSGFLCLAPLYHFLWSLKKALNSGNDFRLSRFSRR